MVQNNKFQQTGSILKLLTNVNAVVTGTPQPVGVMKNYVFEAGGIGTFTAQIQAVGPLGVARNLPVFDELKHSYVLGDYNITAAGFYSVSVPLFTSIQANVSAIDGVHEVDSLTVNTAPTANGNVTVTLDTVNTNVAVTTGTAEVDTLTITSAPQPQRGRVT